MRLKTFSESIIKEAKQLPPMDQKTADKLLAEFKKKYKSIPKSWQSYGVEADTLDEYVAEYGSCINISSYFAEMLQDDYGAKPKIMEVGTNKNLTADANDGGDACWGHAVVVLDGYVFDLTIGQFAKPQRPIYYAGTESDWKKFFEKTTKSKIVRSTSF